MRQSKKYAKGTEDEKLKKPLPFIEKVTFKEKKTISKQLKSVNWLIFSALAKIKTFETSYFSEILIRLQEKSN